MKKRIFIIIYLLIMGFVLISTNDSTMFATKLEYVKCGTANGIPAPVPQMTTIAFTLLIVGTPLVLIIFSVIALIKAISDGNADNIMKVRSKLMKKVIATVVIFLMAGLGRFILTKVATNDSDKSSVSSCISCFLYNSGCTPSDSGNDVNTTVMTTRGQIEGSTSSNTHSSSNSSTITSSNDASRVSSSNSSSPTTTSSQVTNTVNGLETGKYGNLNYYLYKPEKVDSRKPLIIYLHGKSECGKALTALDSYGYIAKIKAGTKYNAYILVPQLPVYTSWITYDSDVMGLISKVVTENGINTGRIAITGFSLGAHGVPDFVKAHPGYFAGAGIISIGTSVNAANFSGVNVWVAWGTADSYTTPYSSTIVTNMQNAGVNVKSTAYQGAGHNGHQVVTPTLDSQEFMDFVTKK